MMRILMFVGIGLGAFLVSMVGALAVQGNLNREGMSQAGILCFFVSPVDQESTGNNTEKTEDGPASVRFRYRTTELEQLKEDLKDRRREYEKKLKDLQVLDERLKTYRRDLEMKKQSLVDARSLIDREGKEIEARERDLNARMLLIENSELDNLRRMASVYEGMTADAAAKVLGRAGEEVAAKVLSQMDERKAAKLLEAFAKTSAEAASQVSERLRNMIHETGENIESQD